MEPYSVAMFLLEYLAIFWLFLTLGMALFLAWAWWRAGKVEDIEAKIDGQ